MTSKSKINIKTAAGVLIFAALLLLAFWATDQRAQPSRSEFTDFNVPIHRSANP